MKFDCQSIVSSTHLSGRYDSLIVRGRCGKSERSVHEMCVESDLSLLKNNFGNFYLST